MTLERKKLLIALALNFLKSNLEDLRNDGVFEEWHCPPTEQEIEEILRDEVTINIRNLGEKQCST